MSRRSVTRCLFPLLLSAVVAGRIFAQTPPDTATVSPPRLKMQKGTTSKITIDVVNPVPAPEQVTLQPDTASLVSVPPVVTIPAGSSHVDVDVLGVGAGVGKIAVTFAPSRGGQTTLVDVLVFEAASITAEPSLVNLTLGTSANAAVHVHVVPPPSSPVAMTLTVTNPAVVEVPAGIIIGTDGTGVIPVRAINSGTGTVTIIPPEIYAASPAAIAITVSLPGGLVVGHLSDARGGEAGGDAITIFGSDFTGPCVPTFGGAPARSVDSQTFNSILVTTPPHAAGVVDVAVRCGTSSFVARNAFTYLTTRIAGLTVFPAVGGARGGSIVEIDGENLHVDSCVARFGETIAIPIWTIGTTSIGVVVPPHAAGNAPLSLVCGNETAAVPGGFNYFNGDEVRPRIEPFDPMWRAGEHVILYGSHFRVDDVVLIDGVAASDLTTLSRSQHGFTLPETPGNVQVKLLDSFGRTTLATIPVYASLTPAATKIPSRVTLGGEFSIEGTGLRKGLVYKLGPALLQPLTITNTSAVFRAPISVGPGALPFTISDHGSVVVTQSIILAGSGMSVSAVSAPCEAADGGSFVTIFGSGFEDGAAVQFGKTYSASLTVKDPFTLVARLPPPFSDTQPRITVSNPDGDSATLTNGFTYTSPSERCAGERRHAAGH